MKKVTWFVSGVNGTISASAARKLVGSRKLRAIKKEVNAPRKFPRSFAKHTEVRFNGVFESLTAQLA